jgi:hypothetical protein
MRGGVVIAAGDDSLHGLEIGQTLEEIKVEGDCILRRIGGIKDIATDKQGIDLLGLQRLDDPVGEARMLGQAVTLDESSAEVPVSGMEDAHSSSNERRAFVWQAKTDLQKQQRDE